MKKRVRFFKKEEGFTILEVVVSIVFLGAIVVSFFSAFTMMINIRMYNESRQASTNFAKTRMEDIKYLAITERFDDIGTLNGSVPGIFKDEENGVEFAGREFNIKTNIWWEDEVNNGRVVPNAYKRVEVIVQEKANYPFDTPVITMTTLVAREEEAPNVNNGTIFVEAQRRFNRQPGVMIELRSPLKKQVTDSEGKIIFTELSPKNYRITVNQDASNNIMVDPTGIQGYFPNIRWIFNRERSIDLERSEIEVVTFEVDWPASINLNLLDGEGRFIDFSQYPEGLSLDIEISEVLFDIARNYSIKRKEDLDVLGSIELWPRYTYNIILRDVVNSSAYNMREDAHAGWDGTFPDSASPQTKNVNLTVAGVVKASHPSGTLPIGTPIMLTTIPENMEIYYTTNNQRPNLGSNLYDPSNPPVVGAGLLRIRAIAYKDGYLIGPEKVFVYEGE